MDGDLVYWNEIQELMEELKLENTFGQWRLFINSIKTSLKVLHSTIEISFLLSH